MLKWLYDWSLPCYITLIMTLHYFHIQIIIILIGVTIGHVVWTYNSKSNLNRILTFIILCIILSGPVFFNHKKFCAKLLWWTDNTLRKAHHTFINSYRHSPCIPPVDFWGHRILFQHTLPLDCFFIGELHVVLRYSYLSFSHCRHEKVPGACVLLPSAHRCFSIYLHLPYTKKPG